VTALTLALSCGLAAAITGWRLLVMAAGSARQPGAVAASRTVRQGRSSTFPFGLARARARRLSSAIDWASALDRVATELRTGSSLGTSVAICAEFGELQRLTAIGLSLATALEQWSSVGRPGVDEGDRRLAIGTLLTVAKVGGGGGAALERAAETIRDRRDTAAERRAQSAQARLSAVVLSVLPGVFTAWSAGSDQRVRTFLLTTRTGIGCLVTGAALNLGGWIWMRHLVGATS
jgi:Flp pilus assembly protein TadB